MGAVAYEVRLRHLAASALACPATVGAPPSGSRLYALPLVGGAGRHILGCLPLGVASRGRPLLPAGRLSFELRSATSAALPSALGLRITRQSTGRPPAAGYRQRYTPL